MFFELKKRFPQITFNDSVYGCCKLGDKSLLLEFHRFAVEIFNKKLFPLPSIAVCGETTALRAVLAAGAPVSTPDIHGGYPLHYAAQMCGGVSLCPFKFKIY